MNRRNFLYGSTCLLIFAGCKEVHPLPRIVIVGDSTAADYRPADGPLMGWGQALKEILDGRATVLNLAVPGSSTKSFSKIYWARTRASLKPGDVLLIQFGHNDGALDPERHTDPHDLYPTLLSNFVADAKKAGARPILVTPLPRYRFSDGKVVNTHGLYPAVMREVARETGVPLVDMTELGAKAMEKLGEVPAREWFMVYFDGQDIVHLNHVGAMVLAKLVESELQRIGVF